MEERTNRSARGGATARLRALLGLGQDPPLPRVSRPRFELVRRGWLGAFWQARIAVRAGIPLDDYLRSRLSRYLALLPVSPSRLPLDVRVDDGQLTVRSWSPDAGANAPSAPQDPAAWLAPLEAVDGPGVRQEVASLEVRLALLEGEVEAARRRRDELEQRLAAEVSAGLVAAGPSVDATAEQLGRPSIRSGAPRAALGLFALAALAAEAWHVALPLLAGAGLDPGALGDELARRPAEVIFAGIFAAGVAAGLLALVSAALGDAAELARGAPDGRRARALAASALFAGAAAAGVAAAIAALPVPGAPGLPAFARALLLVAVPASAAAALRAARREDDARVGEELAALAWDRERARALGERARRLDEIAAATAAEAALAREADAARRRLRELGVRAGLAARRAARAAQAERTALSRLARSLVAALELDRYEYVRQASACGAAELVAQRRRPAERPALEPAAAAQGGRAIAS
jgi:hypothetical protein